MHLALISLLMIPLTVGCGGENEEKPGIEPDCGEGFALADDGNCYPAAQVNIDADGDADADADADTDADADADTVLTVGESIAVPLAENPSTGFSWTVISPVTTDILSWTSEYTADDGDLTGAGGTRTYTFTGVAPGPAAVELHYARSWEEVAPAEIFSMGVTVIEAGSDTGSAFECIKYDFCCETFCEPEGETSHYGEPDPCDCAEDYEPDPRACEAVGSTCAFVD